MKQMAGIILVCEINGEVYAFLSKRPHWNAEIGNFESWGGGYQITAVGEMKDEDGGDFRQCALRELAEETGLGFLPHLDEVNRVNTNEKNAVTYASVVQFRDIIKVMQMTHLVPVNAEMTERIKDMFAPRADGTTSEKTTAFLPQDGIRMFNDEKYAVMKALSFVRT
ncbi:MAG: NUDIX domain-containing protein [Patescibacteria group bacterium]|mgnify:CR=1 FL=1